MEPGDLGSCPGLSRHLCDSKVESANPASLTPLLCKRKLLWSLPASGYRWGESAEGSLTTEGPGH